MSHDPTGSTKPLLKAATYSPGAIALVCAETGASWSYERLEESVARVAACLPAERKGVVAWISRATPHAVAAYLGALASDRAVLPVPANLSEPLLMRILDAYEPEILLALREDPLPPAVCAAYDAALAHADRGTESPVVVWKRRRSPTAAVDPDVHLLLSTSGSTGSPKMVRLTRGNVLSNAEGIVEALHIQPHECAITSLPLFYSFGLSVLHSHVLAGARLVLTERSLMEPEFWDAIEEHGCTSLAGVPYMYGMLKRIGFQTRVPASLHTLTQAGGKLSTDLIHEFGDFMEARGGRLYVMYGQTEATARITVLPPDLLTAKRGGVGLPLRGGTLQIRGSDGEVLPHGASGEILYRGPNVMLGYAESRQDLDRGDELHGVLETGDLGYLDRDGCLFVTGRRKRIAKVFGLRVSLDELESRLAASGPAAVTGADDAIVVFTVPARADAVRKAMIDLATELHLHSSAFRLRTVTELPLLSTGKIDYASLPNSDAAG